MGRKLAAFAPATIANFGPGFDILGAALEGIGDTVTVEVCEGSEVSLRSVDGDLGRLPRLSGSNTAAIAARETLKKAGVSVGLKIDLQKGLPIGSGLGSSAASAAAAAYATNRIIGSPLRRSELIGPCVKAEAIVSGHHADNVAPALLGGMVAVRSLDPIDVIRLPIPEGLAVVVVTPAMELSTKKARAAMPEKLTLSSSVQNSANLAAFVAACHSGDIGLLGRCVFDGIATPARLPLVPGGSEVISRALECGALGSAMSGAGPSIFALCRSRRSAEECGLAMSEGFAENGMGSVVRLSRLDCPGARII